jgi:hypothetical protein
MMAVQSHYAAVHTIARLNFAPAAPKAMATPQLFQDVSRLQPLSLVRATAAPFTALSVKHKTPATTTAVATKSDIDKMLEAVKNSPQTETMNDMSMAVKTITSAFRETQIALEESRKALKDEKAKGQELELEVLALREIKKKADGDEEQEASYLKRYLSQYAGDDSMCDDNCNLCGRCRGKLEYGSDFVQRQFQIIKEKISRV